MEAKEKAEELIARFRFISYDLDDIANHKECAMVAVDEVLSIYKIGNQPTQKYWQQVKTEINNL
jgi:hypothetical protein